MKLQIKYDLNLACKVILQEQLDALDIPHEMNGIGEVSINRDISKQLFIDLKTALGRYGIEIVDNPKLILTQKIKDLITEIVFLNKNTQNLKLSYYLGEKLNYSYNYLSNVFSEITYSSIENYFILQKIERVKELIIEDNLSFTEIAYMMNYSSVAHLSTQFKKTTGLAPSTFVRIVKKRNEANLNTN